MLMSLGVLGLPIGLLRWHKHYFLQRDDSKRYRNDGQSIFLRWSLVEVNSVDNDLLSDHSILEKERILAMERREGLNGFGCRHGVVYIGELICSRSQNLSLDRFVQKNIRMNHNQMSFHLRRV
jgi:hypothetical protein